MILMTVGLVIRLLCIHRLNTQSFWRIVPPKELVTDGLYKKIRHPMYLGSLIFAFGLFYALTSLGTALALEFLAFQFILDRIDREEQWLMVIFKQEYIQYMSRTKMLIPYLF